MKAVYHYDLSSESSTFAQKSQVRRLTRQGRSGLNPLSVHQRFEFDHHTLNLDQGSFTFWVLSLEDSSTTCTPPSMGMSNPHNGIRSLLVDSPKLTDLNASHFALLWQDYWHPGLIVRHYPGSFYPDAFSGGYKAVCKSVGFNWHKNQWNQFTYTWDKAAGELYLYINGVCVGSSDRMTKEYHFEKTGETLYAGGIPCFVYSDLHFYDTVMSAEEVEAVYNSDVIEPDDSYLKSLKHHYAGEGNPTFSFIPDTAWELKIDLSLQQQEDLDSIYVQGYDQAVQSKPEGLYVHTPKIPYWKVVTEQEAQHTEKQLYLWLKPWLEGDLYAEYEFMPMEEGGLMLFMAQCSGFWGEDFMRDYPLKTSGKMTTVFGEDVRNYHWECWRDMNDVRNDVPTHGLIKQPYGIPLGHGTQQQPVKLKSWNRLQFLQEDSTIRGAINGEEVIQLEDLPFRGTGSALHCGHIAIRCMINTEIYFRNLKVYNRTP